MIGFREEAACKQRVRVEWYMLVELGSNFEDPEQSDERPRRWKSEDLLVVRLHFVDMQMVGPYPYDRSCFS